MSTGNLSDRKRSLAEAAFPNLPHLTLNNQNKSTRNKMQ